MPQKKKGKKTNKKTHRKKHLTQKQNIIFQSIPNYSSGQFTGHQNNKNNIQYAPVMQQETRTDNLVGDLVGRLISKIETDGNKQTQQYTQDIQPTNNNNNENNNVVNIYNDGTKKEDKNPDATTEPKEGRSAAEDFGIQTASAVTGLLGVGALGVAYNSDAASKAKLKLKKVGGGILGAVTSAGAAINNNILKRGTKLGGDKPTTNLIKEEGKLFEKKGKAGTYARLEDEMNPLQADFDKHINQPSTAKQSLKPLPQKQSIEPKTLPQKPADTPTPTPSKISTDTPVPRINIFSPAKHIGNFKPQNIFSPATPILDISKGGRTNLMEPVESTLRKMNASDRIKAIIKRNSVQRDLKDVNQEANKLQSAFRNFKAKNIVRTKREARKQTQSRAPMEIASTVQPARLSGVHETSRQGATTTRIHTQNQAIAQLRQQPPTRQSSGTAISNATTTTPQARGRGSSIKDLKPLPESEKRGRGRPQKVSSGQDEGPREIGSARTLTVGSGYEKKNTGQAAKKK